MDLLYSGSYQKPEIKHAVELMSRPSRWVVLIRFLFGILVVNAIVQKIFHVTYYAENISWLEWISILILARIFHAVFIRPYVMKRQSISRLLHGFEKTRMGQIEWRGIKFVSPELKVVGWIDWDLFIGVRKSQEILVLWTADQRVTILPKRFFRSEKDWNTVLEIVNMRVVEAQMV